MSSYSCRDVSSAKSKNVKPLSSLLKLVGEENRLRLLCILQDGEHCVCELGEHISGLSQSLMSHHLADLKAAGIISARKDGLRVYYQLTESGERIVGAVFTLQNLSNEKARCPGGECSGDCQKGRE